MSETKKIHQESDPLAEKREERAMRNFKQVIREILYLLMQATRSETVSLYWVNKQRKQFVLESSSSRQPNASFQDRVDFEHSWMEPFTELEEPIQLEVGIHLKEDQLTHYYRQVPVRFLNLIPFMNNNETVAITVLETNDATVTSDDEESVIAFTNAMSNLLYTFLELSDLSRDETQWAHYDETLDQINIRDDHAVLLDNVCMQMQSYVTQGGVSLLCRGADQWRVVLSTHIARNAPHIGTVLDEQTIAFEALRTGRPEFSIHFNSNPRRVSPLEPLSKGATLALPLLLHDRRQAVFLVYDENPLIFKESLKHKLTNLARVTALKIMSDRETTRISNDFMSHETGAFGISLVERTILREIKRSRLFPEIHTWVAMITFDQVNELRTRFGLEVLRNLQKQVVSRIIPQTDSVFGIAGFHSDYIYTVVLQSAFEDGIERWLRVVEREGLRPFEGKDDPVELSFRLGYTRIADEQRDLFELTRDVKRAFSEAIRSGKFAVEV